jgi:hypothetical protein
LIAAAAALLGLLLAASPGAAEPAPTPRSPGSRTPGPHRRAGPPLDFSGVWELDSAESRGVAPSMEGAVISVRQNGNRIWIEPVDARRSDLLADEIVVDGRKYEKNLGRQQKGTVIADWGKDRSSLWLQAVVDLPEGGEAAAQRMVWRLRDGGRVWTRQTWIIEQGKRRETFLVFRKREAEK